MPVVDGEFIPRSPLTHAERHVDWAGHNNHIVARRALVEESCAPFAKRIGLLASQQHGHPSQAVIDLLAEQLKLRLDQTARFGHDEAVREITALRASAERRGLAEWTVPDAGQYGEYAKKGLAGVAIIVAQRGLVTARAVAEAASAAVLQASTAGGDTLTAATTAATRSLHLRVLELVGETLNLGRTAGALTMSRPPEFALRSEQLDTNTCGPCEHLHGTIVIVGTPDFFAILPPSGCLGGGRCRGLMVFGDGPRDVRQPEQLAA